LRLSLEWLGEYVDIEMSPADLADALSLSGTAVDRVHTLGCGVTGVVVAQVREVKAHPGADALKLALVDDGVEVREIVCGAANLVAGMKSPFARVGATLPAVTDKPLKKARIRGVDSEGMLLAADELGIGDDHTGIIELAPDAELGADVHDILPLEDIVFELEITPNRPDCMSVVGVAREVSALTGAELRMPSIELDETGEAAEGLTTIVIEDPHGCPRYTARLVIGVDIAPSPAWMQRRLTAAGLRPISNVVDVTNYVLLEVGQPLHAFDLEILKQHTIIVRKARPGEPIKTLDGIERELDPTMLVIADAEDPVALAGVIGGEDSEVTDRSTNILIESAHFDPTSILLTSKRLGVRTEASGRFERGVDPGGTSFAAARAARLMNELAGGRVAVGEIDVYPARITPVRIDLRCGRARDIIGADISDEKIESILTSLCAQVEKGKVLKVTPPTFRRDLEREIDLVEEIARIYGYDRIPSTLPSGGGIAAGLTAEQKLAGAVVESLVGQGLSQVVTYSFMRTGDLDLLGLEASDGRRSEVRMLNPLAETGDTLRTTLLPGMLRVAASNANRGNKDLALFETGRVFISRGMDDLPEETETISLLLCGRAEPLGWSNDHRAADFFDLKGVVENLASALGAPALDFEPADEPFLAPGRSGNILIDGGHVGYLGRLHPDTSAAFDLEGDVFVAEIASEPLIASAGERVYSPVGRYPNVKVDIAVIVEESTPARDVQVVITSNGGPLLKSARLFDAYRGPQIGEGKKSLAYALEFGSGEGTLTDEEAHRHMDRVIEALGKELAATIRGREREGDVS
jgi:phenylalanyl-tRNA synthetase beta chain